MVVLAFPNAAVTPMPLRLLRRKMTYRSSDSAGARAPHDKAAKNFYAAFMLP
jgi:hypothetical protein